MELLKELYRINSESGNEKELTLFIIKYIQNTMEDVLIEKDRVGNIYLTKGDEDTFPCFVAHLDEVHSKTKRSIITENNKIYAIDINTGKNTGIGADDKNGIWIALSVLKTFPCVKVAFFIGEEVGCVGSSNCDMTFFDDCRWVVQFDRKGNSDFISSIGMTPLCGDDFIEDAKLANFGFVETNGLFTDVLTLKEQGLRVSCCNVSCGYYKPHTSNEYTITDDLYKCLAFARHLVENCTKVYKHDYVLEHNKIHWMDWIF